MSALEDTRTREKPPLWSGRYVLAILVNYCIASIFYLLVTTTALYAIHAFQADEVVAGVVSGSFVVGSLVARLVGGKFLDVVGRKRTLLVGMLVCVLLAVAQIFIADLTLLIVVRGLHGIAFGVASTAVTAGVFAVIPASRRAEGTGYYGISTTFGSATGAFVGTILIASFGYESLFVAAASLAALGLAASLVLRLPERELTDADRAALGSWSIWTFVDRSSLPVATVMLIAGISFSSVLSFVNPYSVHVTGEAVGGTYFAVYGGVVLLTRLFVGRLHDRFGDDAVMYPLLACLVAGTAVLAFGAETWIAVLSAVLMGFGFGALMPTVQSIGVTLAGTERVALATSTFFLMTDIGVGLGPVLDGAIAGAVGYQGMYVALSGIGLLATVYYAFTHGRRRTRRLAG